MADAANGSRFRNWVFTINNPNDVAYDIDDGEYVFHLDRAWLPDNCTYCIMQLERGEAGTKHFQGYLEFDQPVRISHLRAWNARGHYEQRKGTQQQAIDYASKEDTRIIGPFKWGKPKAQGSRTDLAKLVEEVKSGKDLLCLYYDNPSYLKYYRHIEYLRSLQPIGGRTRPKVAILWGDSGSGKSSAAWTAAGADAYLMCENGSGPQWWQGYRGQKQVIFDEFSGKYPYRQLCQVIDIHPYRVQCKGGSAALSATHFIFTSNTEPEEWYAGRHDGNPLRRRFREWALIARFKRAGPTEPTFVTYTVPDGRGGRTVEQQLPIIEFFMKLIGYFDD